MRARDAPSFRCAQYSPATFALLFGIVSSPRLLVGDAMSRDNMKAKTTIPVIFPFWGGREGVAPLSPSGVFPFKTRILALFACIRTSYFFSRQKWWKKTPITPWTTEGKRWVNLFSPLLITFE